MNKKIESLELQIKTELKRLSRIEKILQTKKREKNEKRLKNTRERESKLKTHKEKIENDLDILRRIESLEIQIASENRRLSRIDRKKQNTSKHENIKIRLFNIRGLTITKWVDMQKLFFNGKEKNILCLTETHHKVERFICNKKLKKFETMKTEPDKGGGGTSDSN